MYILLVFVMVGCQNQSTASKQNFNAEQYMRESLTKDGYEVIDLGITDNNEVYIKVKSFGDRKEQIDRHLMDLALIYPTATKYKVQITSSAKDCYYEIEGLKYREYVNRLGSNPKAIAGDAWTNESINLMIQINSAIVKSERCY